MIKLKNSIKKNLLFVLFFIISCMGTAFAGDVTFLTPQTYTRTTKKPLTHSHTFAIPANYSGPGFYLRLINGDPRENHRVSSAVIKLNGVQVIGPADFNRQVGFIERIVTLEPANEITVKLHSKPGAFVFIDIYKFIAKPAVSFSASPATISYKQSSTLGWSVTGADSVSIDNGIGSAAPGGSMAVSPQVPNTTYTLTAANLGGATTAAATVTVIFPPPTVSFSTSGDYIQPGSAVTLTWATEVAQTVTIEPSFGSVDLSGSMPVTPAESTTFRLFAVGYGGAVAAETAVIVDGTAPQVQITSHEDGAVVREIPISLGGTFVEVVSSILCTYSLVI